MPNGHLPVPCVQVLALDVEVALSDAALVAEALGLSPGPVTAHGEAPRLMPGAPSQRWPGLESRGPRRFAGHGRAGDIQGHEQQARAHRHPTEAALA
jgi:hypothetical protein